jgi:hypothetical protein
LTNTVLPPTVGYYRGPAQALNLKAVSGTVSSSLCTSPLTKCIPNSERCIRKATLLRVRALAALSDLRPWILGAGSCAGSKYRARSIVNMCVARTPTHSMSELTRLGALNVSVYCTVSMSSDPSAYLYLGPRIRLIIDSVCEFCTLGLSESEGVLRGVRVQVDEYNVGPHGSRPHRAVFGSLRRLRDFATLTVAMRRPNNFSSQYAHSPLSPRRTCGSEPTSDAQSLSVQS